MGGHEPRCILLPESYLFPVILKHTQNSLNMTVIPKKLLLLIIITLVCILFILVYSSQLGSGSDTSPSSSLPTENTNVLQQDACPNLIKYPADIETNSVFQDLDLHPPWMERREFWGGEYEDRYTRRKAMWPHLPLRVIIMPHSHTDPGWLQTVEGYFATSTKSIISNIVSKLTQHQNMTFIFSEASYMWMWWESADATSREQLRSLLNSGRLEITTGGWVMTDEANSDLFSMIDQLVEGHLFMRSTLGVIPTSSWSVDSFGHGGAFPYLLGRSEIRNMVIMRIHYAWKEWMARHQKGDFLWKQTWEKDGSSAPLCHNFPYDIYSIKHSCGPNPQTCLGFDFRHLDGEYNEFTAHYTPINSANLKQRAELLLDQYGRTGSLLPHNVVLVPLGDDFRYSNEKEFDQQYENYMQIMKFINSGDYHAHVSFGTLKDYFSEVRSRMSDFSTLSGDFHVYSDIFSEGRPAYWSGYYFTRPYIKLLSRQVASKLRGVEIMYTLVMGMVRKRGDHIPHSVLASLYVDLVDARRALSLFQHHDAITGTSKEYVMNDYEVKLRKALKNLNKLEGISAFYTIQKSREEIMMNRPLLHVNPRNKGEDHNEFILIDLNYKSEQKIVLYNSLPHQVERIGYFLSNYESICVFDDTGEEVDVQVAPFYNVTDQPRLDLSKYSVWFRASLDAISVSVFAARKCAEKYKPTKVYCVRCPDSSKYFRFTLRGIPDGAVQLENQIYKLLFDAETKLLTNITNKVSGKVQEMALEFSSYTSKFFRSGAYLFAVEETEGVPTEIPLFTAADIADVMIVSGPVFSEIRVLWQIPGQGGLATFLHSVQLVHGTGPLSEAIHLQNMFDLGPSPNFRDTEFFMRLESGLKNGGLRKLFTDQAGLSMVERTFAEQAGIEGNLYPFTESAYIEDKESRLTLLVDHASGVSSRKEGRLEVMIDKRTMNDDARGMGEGVLDSRMTLHRYTVLLEPASKQGPMSNDALPTLSPLASRLSRYLEHPPSLMFMEEQDVPHFRKKVLMTSPLPCDHDLINLRSWNPKYTLNGANALLILRRYAPDCSWTSLTMSECLDFTTGPTIRFSEMQATIQQTSLTANHLIRNQISNISLSPMEISAYNVTFY